MSLTAAASRTSSWAFGPSDEISLRKANEREIKAYETRQQIHDRQRR